MLLEAFLVSEDPPTVIFIEKWWSLFSHEIIYYFKTSEKQLYIENILRKHIQLLQRYLQINVCLSKCVYEFSNDYT